MQSGHSPHSWGAEPRGCCGLLDPPGSLRASQEPPCHRASALFFHQQAAYVNSPPPPPLPPPHSYASAGEAPYLIGEQPVLGYPACPGIGHQHSGRRMRSPPLHPPRGPQLHPVILVPCPAGKTLSPAPREEDRVPREMWDGQPPAHPPCAPPVC